MNRLDSIDELYARADEHKAYEYANNISRTLKVKGEVRKIEVI